MSSELSHLLIPTAFAQNTLLVLFGEQFVRVWEPVILNAVEIRRQGEIRAESLIKIWCNLREKRSTEEVMWLKLYIKSILY